MRKPRSTFWAWISSPILFVAALPSSAQTSVDIDAMRLNQIQVIGSHNSFKEAVDPDLYDIMVKTVPDAEALDYAHPPLTDQLKLGVRGLELDLYHDPEGGRYSKPLGLSLVRLAGNRPRPFDIAGKMQSPGFKVLHVQDIDFRSNCLTLTDALEEIRSWSEKNPQHLPIIITVNLSDASIPLPGSVQPLPFDREALDALDQELSTKLGKENIIWPDTVRRDHETLEGAVRAGHWPTLSEARGRFLIVLDDLGQKRETYLAGHLGLRGRVMFVNSSPGNPEAAVMILNNPLTEGEAIADLVRQGYLVRTRADSGTHEARRGNYSRFEAAKNSGAQVISTDFYQTDWRLNPTYRIRFSKGSCWRLNTVIGPTRDKRLIAEPLE